MSVSTQLALAADEARSARPRKGDVLVYAEGERIGQKIAAAEIAEGAAPRFAYPMDPVSGTVRDASRLNQILLARLPVEALTPAAQKHAADGIVAFSAICTHYGCQVTLLSPDKRSLMCNCHGSKFDGGNTGEVLNGPAARRLAALPITTSEGFIVVAGGFLGRLGPPTT